MSRYGWHHESYRHGLAARGIKTNYYAKKGYFAQESMLAQKPKDTEVQSTLAPVKLKEVPKQEQKSVQPQQEQRDVQRGAQREFKEAQARAKLGELLQSQQPEVRAVDAIQKGQLFGTVSLGGKDVMVRDILSGRTQVSADLKRAVQSAAAVRALQLAQSGNEIPEEYMKALTPETRRRVENLRATQSRLEHPEAPWKTGLKMFGADVGKEALIGAAELPERGLAFAAEVEREQPIQDQSTRKQFRGLDGSIDELKRTPFFTDNALTDDAPGYNREEGSLAFPPHGSAGEIPRLSGIFRFSTSMKDLAKQPDGTAQQVQKRVDSLHAAKGRLSDVSLDPFDKGTQAFEKGNREALIKAINDLEAQSARLKDNWTLTEQVHAQVVSPQNNMSSYNGGDGVFDFSSAGGNRVADQTEKINAVKKDIKNGYNEVKSRSKLLQFRLQRLDANVKPEHGAPYDVKRFADEGGEQGIVDILTKPVAVMKDVFGGNVHNIGLKGVMPGKGALSINKALPKESELQKIGKASMNFGLERVSKPKHRRVKLFQPKDFRSIQRQQMEQSDAQDGEK